MNCYEAELSKPRTTAQELRTAIDEKQFEIYYEPLVDVRDHFIYGVEALIRWNHPARGQVLPADFIPLAEETGLIVPIGGWVLQRACADLQVMRVSQPNLLLSVNVSSRQLDEPDFLCDLSEILQQTEVPHRLLQLEITESIFLRDEVRIGALFSAIRSMGVKIAFDDFGTGYSSLNYLQKYPVDVLKVDRSFVKGIGAGRVSGDIVQHIVHLAQTLEVGVSAEGVERPEQAAALEACGCYIAQGFMYSRPLPLHAITVILAHSLEAFGVRKAVRPAQHELWSSLSSKYSIP